MITFLTLFLGLTVGPQPVELAVRGEPARVVLRLDGETVGERTAPPWRFECPFGGELAPRRLEAVAYDAGGAEIASAVQPVNLTSRIAALALAIEGGSDGRPAAIRPVWQSFSHPRPASLTVQLDGTPLPVSAFERIELPDLDSETIHFVTAEAVFPGGVVARAETAFGGVLGRTVSTRNTAVAVVAPQGRALRTTSDAAGLLTAGGAPATVLSVEQGAADLVAVVTPAAEAGLAALRRRLLASGRTAMEVGLDDHDRLFQIDPVPSFERPKEGVYEVYDRSGPFNGERAGLVWWLSGLAGPQVQSQPTDGAPRPADATAVAAMQAVASARPRVVLLVLGREERDASRFPAETVRAYLRQLRVPLAVWFVEPPFSYLRDEFRRRELERRRALDEAGRAPGNWEKARRQRLEHLREQWGEVTDASEPLRLIDAAYDLRRSLEDQRVIWIDGAWLPHEVELTPAAADTAGGVHWAG